MRLGANQVQNVSLDQSSDGRVYVHYNPLRDHIGDTADVLKQEADNPNTILASKLMVAHISPLRPLSHTNADPFLQMALSDVVNIAPDRIEVTASVRRNGGDQDLRVRFWTEPSPPVIESIVYGITFPDGRRSETRAVLSRFTECPGGMVARRVVYARCNAAGATATVREWVSDDLGDVPPVDADFVISVPTTTTIYGLRGDFAPGKIRNLDPSKIRLTDVEDPTDESGIAEAPADSPRSGGSGVGWLRSIFLLGNAAAFLAAVAFWIRRRQASKSK